jgi:hypothetical protein
MVIRHGVFHAGSSKHGKARRAPIAWNCDNAYHSPPSLWRKIPSTATLSTLPR